MIIDSHCHINSKVIGNLDKSINEINNNKLLESVVNIGLDIETSRECIKISDTQNKFFNSVGIHPLYVENQDSEELFKLVNKKTVAIGEIGLDNNKNNYYK